MAHFLFGKFTDFYCEDVARALEATGGGCILTSSHDISADTSVDNILAMYDENAKGGRGQGPGIRDQGPGGDRRREKAIGQRS